MHTRYLCAAVAASLLASTNITCGDDPFADVVISFDPGTDPHPSYPDPQSVLGPPERLTGEGVFPGVVTPFNPAWGTDELVSIGTGGWITVGFDTPITDDPRNPFGIDLILFGNAGFIDAAWPTGIVGGGLFGADGGGVEVSADGLIWHAVESLEADGLFPSLGYLDCGPYDEAPTSLPSQFTRPVDPALTMRDLAGMSHEQVIAAYAGSGGGVGVDISALGLAEISYVRVSNFSEGSTNVEVEACADVTPLGDLDENHTINVLDLLLLLGDWGATGPGAATSDLHRDGVVNVLDLLVMLGNWG